MPTIVTAINHGRRTLTATSFADLTPATVTSIDVSEPGEGEIAPWQASAPAVTVTFDADLTDRQLYEVRRRIRTIPELEDLEKRAINAWQTIEDFNAQTIPSNATQQQINNAVIAEVKLLGNVVQAMMETMFPEARLELLGE